MKSPKFSIVAIVFALALVVTGQTAHAALLRPDLTITSVTSQFNNGNWYLVYTVKNIGATNAGTFYIKIRRGNVVETEFSIAGLAVGASRTYRRQMPICGFTRTIIVDSRFQIIESNEANNSRTFENFC